MSRILDIKAIAFALTLLLPVVCGFNHALADDKQIAFEADSVVVSQVDGSLLATGNVLLEQAGSTVKADEVTYFQLDDRAVARGNVIYTDIEGTITYANYMILKTEFTHIVAETLISQFASGGWMKADHVDRIAGDKAVFKKSQFTPCNCDFVNGELPLWDIRASQSTRNEKTKTITHQNLRMHVLNLPIFYLPYLTHPDWTVRRRSGFLTPSFLVSSDVGFAPSVPYFHIIDDTSDVEVTTHKYQYRGAAVKTRYRKLYDKSEIQADLYIANVETYKKNREAVGAIDARFDSELDGNWNVKTRLLRSSQDTFLRRYKFNTETSLKSSATAERLMPDRYYYVEVSDRQSLTSANDNINEPTIFPHIYFEKTRQGWRTNQQLRTEISALQLDNDGDHDYARWSGVFEAKEALPLKLGIANYTANVTANYYEIHNQPNGATTKLGTIAHANPSFSLGWRLPMTVSGFKRSAIIQPNVQFTYVGGNNRTDDIPNRDAAEYRIDEANLFLTHRYQGKDYILPGTRADIGIAASANDNAFINFAGFIGISRRLSGTPSAGLNTNQDDKYSDYVTSLAINSPSSFDVRWSGRMSSHDFNLNESKTLATKNFGRGSVSVTHSQLSQAYFASSDDDREELSAALNHSIGSGWSFSTSQIWDMSYGKTVRDKSTAAFNWAGGSEDCLQLTVKYQRDPNVDRDIGAVDQIDFVVSFNQLGS